MAVLDRLVHDLPRSTFSADLLEKGRRVLAADADIAKTCGTSTLACESVPAAQIRFLRSHDTFEHAIVAAAALGGDVDSICALVGWLAGALHGFSGIPVRWLDAVAHESPTVVELCALADALSKLPP